MIFGYFYYVFMMDVENEISYGAKSLYNIVISHILLLLYLMKYNFRYGNQALNRGGLSYTLLTDTIRGKGRQV